MSLSTQDRILIESRITNEGPSIVLAYLLWFFLGLFSAHRFYLGRPGSAILQILSYIIVIGFIWVLVDAFLIPSMIRKKQEELRQKLTLEALSYAQPTQPGHSQQPITPQVVATSQAPLPVQLPHSSDLTK